VRTCRARPAAEHRVPAVEQRRDLGIAQRLELRAPIGHGHALGLADIDPAEQCDEGRHAHLISRITTSREAAPHCSARWTTAVSVYCTKEAMLVPPNRQTCANGALKLLPVALYVPLYSPRATTVSPLSSNSFGTAA